jgi:spermidine synthase
VQALRRAGGRGLGLRGGGPAFLLGFLAIAFQIYLLREFAAHFYGNELLFGFVLGAWLLWGGIGSLVGPRLGVRPDRLPLLYASSVAMFFVSLALLRFSHRLLGILPGELTGLVPAIGFSLALALFVSFPLGLAFVLNAALLDGNAPRVYLLESLGAAAGGLAVHLFLIPRFSNWEGAAVVAAAAAAAFLLAFRPSRTWPLVPFTLALAAGLAIMDLPAARSAWKPFALAASEDTPYGKLQVIRTADQFSLYSDGLAVFAYPDTEAAEEAVHFALLQRSGAKDVLLIGGGAGGGCAETLKHQGTRADYVEIDPAVIRLAERFLPADGRAALRDPRICVILEDGRRYLERTDRTYDAILLSLPEPATAQLNRFYTREFFQEAAGKLRPAGVLSLVVPSAENYIGEDLQKFLATLDTTLRSVFPHVAAVPGGRNVFLASSAPLATEPAFLAAELARRGIRTKFVGSDMLPARMSPLRVEYLERRIRAGPGIVNRDLVPVSYYFHSVLWAAQFRGLEARVLRLLARIPPFWALDAPLVLAALLLALAALKGGRSPARFLVPLMVAGFTSILVEMAVLIVFQSRFGYVYGKISLLLAAFMAGLFVGSLGGLKRRRVGVADLAAVQGGLVVGLVLTKGWAGTRGAEVLPLLALLVFGALGGYLFVAANRLYLASVPHPGMGYGIELLGSFLGVGLASAFIIPFFGIPRLLGRLTVLNVLAFLFILAAVLPRRRAA